MAYPVFTFDGPNKSIDITSEGMVDGTISFTIGHLYSEWKEWVLSGEGSKFHPAFRTIGGDPIGGGLTVGAYLFLANDQGWTLRPPAVNGVRVVVEGNLYPEDVSYPLVEYRDGYAAFFEMRNSSLTQVSVTGSGVTSQDKTDIITGVRSEMDSQSKKLKSILNSVE